MTGSLLRTLLLSIICIFLCVPFSADAQDHGDEDDPLGEALRWERVVSGSDDPETIFRALRSKAICYANASLYADALRTMERVRVYLLDPEEVWEVLVDKAIYAELSGDPGVALGYLEESGKAGSFPGFYSVLLAGAWRFEESLEQALRLASSQEEEEAIRSLFKKAPRRKKENNALAWSFIPPAGQLYLGKPSAGILSLILNAGAAGFTVYELIHGDWVTGLLGGGLLLNETFFKGNIEKNLQSVEAVNKRSIEAFMDSLDSLIQSLDNGVIQI